MTVKEFREDQAAMPDQELLTLVKADLSKLCITGGKSIHMSVPPRPTDTDMLIVELIRRYEEKIDIASMTKSTNLIKE
jgi:hypothetical protein